MQKSRNIFLHLLELVFLAGLGCCILIIFPMVFASIFVERIFLNFSRSSSSEKGACGSCGMWSFSGDEEKGGELLLVLKVGLCFWYRNVMEP